MLPFFRTPERITALDAAARSWLGTPFAAGGGAAKGPRGGATCHELCLQTIADAGYPVPPYRHHNQRPTFASHTAREWMLEAFRAFPGYMAEVWTRGPLAAPPPPMPPLMPGDILILQLNLAANHCALHLEKRRILHTLRATGAIITAIPGAVPRNLRAVFRPVEEKAESLNHPSDPSAQSDPSDPSLSP
jgi:cell wall-associated NlpC family hydrolase